MDTRTGTEGTVIALLGAESTGKTSTAQALRERLAALGIDAAVVPEYLREFCDRAGRTPRPDEQAHIARVQTERIDAAARAHEVVLADTTALMTAIYSELLFDDPSLLAAARAAHARARFTLLMGLDLPWQADGLQRDGPHVREPVDGLVRRELARLGLPYAVVYGAGHARVTNALRALRPHLPSLDGADLQTEASPRLRAWCAECLVPECEHRLFGLDRRTDG
ncbi:MAG TPA: ATP-binding protein [Burkholderiaceae bacterium]|nr:ATP-binding protein [Burkholderiaceae bacterium]